MTTGRLTYNKNMHHNLLAVHCLFSPFFFSSTSSAFHPLPNIFLKIIFSSSFFYEKLLIFGMFFLLFTASVWSQSLDQPLVPGVSNLINILFQIFNRFGVNSNYQKKNILE